MPDYFITLGGKKRKEKQTTTKTTKHKTTKLTTILHVSITGKKNRIFNFNLLLN